MLQKPTREFLDALWRKVVIAREINISQDPSTEKEVSDEELRSNDVHCVSMLVNDSLESDMIDPSFLFTPLAPEVLRDHPLRPETESLLEFYDLGHPPLDYTGVSRWTTAVVVRSVCKYVKSWTLDFWRPGLHSSCGNLATLAGLHRIR